MSKKHKNIINIDKAKQTFRSMDLNAKVYNNYQIRIYLPDIEDISFFDWYHTTGTLVMCTEKYCANVGRCLTADEVCNVIFKEIQKL